MGLASWEMMDEMQGARGRPSPHSAACGIQAGALLQPALGTSFPRDNQHVLIMSTWVNESCLFHLIDTSPFLAIHICHAGPGVVHPCPVKQACWELGEGAGVGANMGCISGELRSGPSGRQSPPWELSRAFPLTAPFLQGRITGTRAEGSCQRGLLPSFGSGKAGPQTMCPLEGNIREHRRLKSLSRLRLWAQADLGRHPGWLLSLSVTLA